MTTNNGSSTSPLTAVVLINWNNFEDTSECLDSLQKSTYENIQIIVVDNGSTDNSLSRLQSKFENVKYVSLDENEGFPAANNAGIEFALENGAEYVFLLNNDTIVPEEDDVLKNLVTYMETNEQVGIVSPLVTYYPETHLVWFSEGSIDWITGKIQHTNMGKSKQSCNLQMYICNDCIPGCAMMIRSELFDRVGLLDPSYFLRFSDTEFSLRALNSGYDLVTDTSVEIFHKASSSSGSKFDLSYYQSRNRWHLIRDYFPKISLLFYFWWLIKATANRGLHRDFSAITDLFWGAKDGILGRKGKVVPPSNRIE
ncbi:glycosyl transferase family 2 [Halorhabdus utahensis DSM 12940]|uniref:Glycosyl transferase family 2 n=1 Tax=Halorhabdus utahensis (strain DSM 12940 / JCM 11049 / AX-2) TaxID=519442 RepID=C7NU60_HALUD|nr:glycosyltransferase family 2 protein [Halorhabdus utahensis]ACV12305.1 glycosyl transferase family 2 [Halorhabdus utahensis DSM 12940]